MFFVISLISIDVVMAADNIGYRKYYEYAIELQRQKKYVESEMVLGKTIEKYPSVALLYYGRGRLRQVHLGRCQEAIQDFSIAIKLAPKANPKAYWRRGACLHGFGFLQRAIRDYSRCLKLAPEYSKVYIMRAKAFGKLGMVKNAFADLDSAVKHKPEYSDVVEALKAKIIAGSIDY